MADLKQILSSPVEVYALGGLGEVGKNLYCIENDSTILIIDCGVMFPDASMPGVDYVIPDFTHLIENQNKIKGLVITHGHEDHIGGIPFLLREIDIPVIYAPKIACAMIRHKIEDGRIRTKTRNNNLFWNKKGRESALFYCSKGCLASQIHSKSCRMRSCSPAA